MQICPESWTQNDWTEYLAASTWVRCLASRADASHTFKVRDHEVRHRRYRWLDTELFKNNENFHIIVIKKLVC